jgi:lipopolysaccharide/colanic/teichoic acid biosynthesis glycosyltransferase
MVSVTFGNGEDVRARGSSTLRSSALLFVVIAAALAVTIGLYGGIYLHTFDVFTLPVDYQLHLLLNLVCTAAVIGFAWQVHGQLDRKLAETVFITILVHGLFAFFILGGRWTFSRPVLLTNAFVALGLGLLVVLLKQRISGPRVALIRPLAIDINLSRHMGEVVTSPSTDLTRFDIILVSFTEGVSLEWARALSRAMLVGCQVRHVGEYVEDVRGSVSLEHFDLDQLSNVSLVSYRPFKRLLDVASVIFVLPLAVSIILLGAFTVFVTMGWPVFFVQERVGLAGRPFRMWKLRTMRPSPPGEAHRAAVPGDARITRIGAFLRRFRIDELPQLWNVLRGEMSLIGPRPEAVPFHEDYVRELPMYAYRNLVRPGITGWAQVCAPPSANSDEAKRKLTYDLFYVKRMSMLLDLQIALRTIWTVTHGSGVR